MNLAVTTPTSATIIDEIEAQDVYGLMAVDIAGATVIDLGANVGIFALYALARGAARVVCVEPNATNCAALAENIAAAGLTDRVQIIQAAVVGWKRGIALVGEGSQSFVAEAGDADYYRLAMGQHGPAPLALPITLPEVFIAGAVGECGFLKVDVERSEFEVLTCTPADILARCRHLAVETSAAPPGAFGAMVEHLTQTHGVTTLGSARRGGYVYARRYGA